MRELMRVRRQESLKACKYVRSRIERQSSSGAWQGPVKEGRPAQMAGWAKFSQPLSLSASRGTTASRTSLIGLGCATLRLWGWELGLDWD